MSQGSALPGKREGRKMGKRAWPVAAIAVAFLSVPTAVRAAVGSFASSTSTAALTVTNSGSGRALTVTSHTNNAAVFTDNATSGVVNAISASNKSASSGASGIVGYENSTGSGFNYGVK